MVGLEQAGEGPAAPPSSSKSPTLISAVDGAGLDVPWEPRGWKQFLQEPGFHRCSANSPHDTAVFDIALGNQAGTQANVEVILIGLDRKAMS